MKIFMSYPSLDRETIRNLVHNLENIGHEVWTDAHIRDVDNWWERVLAGVRECDLFLFGLTPNWCVSNACLREFDYATTLGKNRLPVRLVQMDPSEIPATVRRLHIVPYELGKGHDDTRDFLALQRAINRLPVPAPLPQELPEPPAPPTGDLDEYEQQLRQLKLERDAQAAMVFELRRALRRQQSAEHARELLNNLRKHPDTTETIASRIDITLSEKAKSHETVTTEMLAVLPEKPATPERISISPENAGALTAHHTFCHHTDTVYSVAFDPTSTLLASAGGDKNVLLYDLLEGSQLALLRGHHAAVRDVVFSPKGTQIASASADNTIRLWGIRKNRDIILLEGTDDWVLRVAYDPLGDVLAASSVSEMTTLWDLRSQTVLCALGGHADWVSGLAFSPDGTTLVSASYDRTIRFWSVARRRRLHIIPDAGGLVEDIAYTPTGTALAAAMQDGTIHLWGVAKRERLTILRGHQYAVHSVDFSPDGQLLASAGADGTLRLWNMKTLKEVASYNQEAGPLWDVTFSPDGGLLAACGEEAAVRVWAVTPS